jgi:transcriptional regulator with XRE-family HTH domain
MGKSKTPLPPGKVLRAWRKKADRTQEECAAEVGVKQSAWAEWESGARTPREASAIEIERLTGGEVPASTFDKPRRGEAA